MIHRILVADDEDLDRELMQETLRAILPEAQICTAANGREACDLIEGDSFDAVFSDLRMPEGDGLEVLARARAMDGPDVVIITGDGDVPTAVQAMKNGCFDYLLKPICADQVEATLTKLREHRRLVEENAYLRSEFTAGAGGRDIIGESEAFRKICAQAVHVSATDATVLLQGETGTGKELISRLIHRHSPRKDGPFIRVNCAALSETLLESELFGHTKGAFTGAHSAKPGRFELADGGTLLLDEITETSEKLQAELLRVIEQKEFERVGGTSTIRVDVRIIATTNRDLAEEVANDRFREDLYYRLNVVPLVLPPLRERQGDVEVLSRYFSGRFARQIGKQRPEISADTMQKLRRYPWPGNVRELENLVQRLVIMDGQGVIEPDDLPEYLDGNGHLKNDSVRHWGPTLEDIERQAILKTLDEVNGNKTRAAEKLNISTRTVRNKLKKYMADGSLEESFS